MPCKGSRGWDVAGIVLTRSIMQLGSGPEPHSPVFPSARTLDHLAFAAATCLALTSGLLRRSFLLAGFASAPAAFALAQRIFLALAKAFISFRLWAADM